MHSYFPFPCTCVKLNQTQAICLKCSKSPTAATFCPLFYFFELIISSSLLTPNYFPRQQCDWGCCRPHCHDVLTFAALACQTLSDGTAGPEASKQSDMICLAGKEAAPAPAPPPHLSQTPSYSMCWQDHVNFCTNGNSQNIKEVLKTWKYANCLSCADLN